MKTKKINKQAKLQQSANNAAPVFTGINKKALAKPTKRYAILCSGGNAQGMNNCINAFTKKCLQLGIEPWGVLDGFIGLVKNDFVKLDSIYTQLFISRGSAFLGSSRYPEFATDLSLCKKAAQNIRANHIDGVIVVGGEGSFKGACLLAKNGIHVVGIPATIDNDVACSDISIGFDSALNKVCDMICDTNDVFISHRGVVLYEIMGRYCPSLTVSTAIANNITYMVTKYSKLDAQGFIDIVKDAKNKHKQCVNIVVTERLYDNEGPNSLKQIAKEIEKATGYMTRHIPIGYIQRGGKPSARDRLLANFLTNIAINYLGKYKGPKAACVIQEEGKLIDLAKAVKQQRKSYNRTLVEEFNKQNKF